MWDLPPAEQSEEIREWLDAIPHGIPGLEQIEVVNEPLHDPTGQGLGDGNYDEAARWLLRSAGRRRTTGYDWIINAFTLAREYFPNAKLMLNDYSITNDGNATTRVPADHRAAEGARAHRPRRRPGPRLRVQLQQSAGVRGHAHRESRPVGRCGPAYLRHRVRHRRCRCIFGVQDDAVQLARYQALFPVFWENEAVKGVTMWGYVQGGHWRTNLGAWLMYPNGAERPALQWLVRYMENNLAVVTPGQAFSVDENAAGGTVGRARCSPPTPTPAPRCRSGR